MCEALCVFVSYCDYEGETTADLQQQEIQSGSTCNHKENLSFIFVQNQEKKLSGKTIEIFNSASMMDLILISN